LEVGQTWNFVHEFAVDDVVATPHDAGQLAVGRISGDAETSDAILSCVRRVSWLRTDLPIASLREDLHASFHPRLTVFQPGASGAAERLLAVAGTSSDPGPDEYATSTRVGAWVFQGNPDRFDLLAAIASGPTEDWAMNQLRDRVGIGDRVWFRLSGKQAGIYATGRITSLPHRRDEPSEFGEWAVDVAFEATVEPPLGRDEILADQALSSSRPLVGAMGTNFAIETAIDARLAELVADRLTPVAVSVSESRRIAAEIDREIGRQRTAVESELLALISGLTPTDFEVLCGIVLEQLGFEDVDKKGAQWKGTLGDGGVDLEARLRQPGFPPLLLRVQAKRQQGNVGPGVVQQLRGALRAGEQGIVMTTSAFTRAALDEASAPGKPPIGLLPGVEIAKVLARAEIGVRRRPLETMLLEPEALRRSIEQAKS
jgi:hypothetical protein